MAQGDIQVKLDEMHVDFQRSAPAVLVTARLARHQVGETFQDPVLDEKTGQQKRDAQGALMTTPRTELSSLQSIEVRLEYPSKAAFWSAGTALRDALVAKFREDQRVAQKQIG